MAVFHQVHDAAHGHDGGEGHFAGGDGAVREGAAAFGDDGARGVEERGPGGVGGSCDEDGFGGEAGEVFGAVDDEAGAGGAAGAAGEATEGFAGGRSLGGGFAAGVVGDEFLRLLVACFVGLGFGAASRDFGWRCAGDEGFDVGFV